MNESLSFSPRDGSATVSGFPIVLGMGKSRSEVATALSPLFRMAQDYGNGNEWLSFKGVTFGSQPCGFALLFRHGLLAEIHFSVMLPDAEMESGWPTKAAIEELSSQLRASIGERQSEFSWGVVWSAFDPRGFQASSGVRYTA
jgi:hypothetical protein